MENLELTLLLEGVFQHYGYDFRHYAVASIKRRVLARLAEEKLATVSELQARLLHDPAAFERFLLGLTVHVTALFRDPGFYQALRAQAVPWLRTYPFVRLWVAGCSTGEEVYSLAILLQEETLYDRCRIYATDLGETVLAKAKAGIFRSPPCRNTRTITSRPADSSPFRSTTPPATTTPSSARRCAGTLSSRSTTW